MKHLLFALLSCFVVHSVKAQSSTYQNSVQVQLEALYVKADQRPQSPVPKYSLLYARDLNHRWRAEAGASYTNRYLREQFSPYQSFFPGQRTQLASFDLTVLYNLLHSNRHALRLGLGPSLWYTRNGAVTDLTGVVAVGGQQLELISYTRASSHSFNLALSLRGNYEYSITSRFVIGARASVGGNILGGDAYSILGGSLMTGGALVGYRF